MTDDPHWQAEFEEYAIHRDVDLDTSRNDAGAYISVFTQESWKAYLTACRSRQKQLEASAIREQKLREALAPLAACHQPPEGYKRIGVTAHFKTEEIDAAQAALSTLPDDTVIKEHDAALIERISRETSDWGWLTYDERVNARDAIRRLASERAEL